MTPEVALLLRTGKLEQSCPACGRWEAAHRYCSFCGRRMGPDDWYRNNDLERRKAARPSVPPARVPDEYHKADRWPAEWGEYPFPRRPAVPAPPNSGRERPSRVSAHS